MPKYLQIKGIVPIQIKNNKYTEVQVCEKKTNGFFLILRGILSTIGGAVELSSITYSPFSLILTCPCFIADFMLSDRNNFLRIFSFLLLLSLLTICSNSHEPLLLDSTRKGPVPNLPCPRILLLAINNSLL
jgi:hypothetical protein